MKMSINLPALERLICGDKELELNLRHQVLENFAKYHLKTIMNDDTWRQASREWRRELDEKVKEKLQEIIDEHNSSSKQIKGLVQADIEKFVRISAQKVVDEALEDNIEKNKAYYKRYIDEQIKKAIDWNVNREVEKEIKRRLLAAAAKKAD